MSYDWPNIDHAARALTGTTAEMATRVRALIGPHPSLPAEAPSFERRRHQFAEHQRAVEMAVLKRRLATDFGARHGWKLTKKPFSLAVLQRGGCWDGRGVCAISTWPPQFTDHPYFYRQGQRAAAVVGHIYDSSPSAQIAAREWAEENGLSVAFPEDFPSWWYPGDTMMVVFTPAGTGIGHGTC